MGSWLKNWLGPLLTNFWLVFLYIIILGQVLLSAGQYGLFGAVGVGPNGYKQLEDVIPEWRLVRG